jgi:hypothetical protein
MNPVPNLPREAFLPMQVASAIRRTSVAVVEPTPNVVSQIVKSGSPKPHATVSNPMAASVDSFTPPPGRNMAHYLTMDVDKAGQENASIADALQRYLNVSPSRKPGGDPRDMDSKDSYPTLIIDEDQAWSDRLPYRFSVNGVAQRQSQPTFYTQGGSLKIRVVGRGPATVATPATEGLPVMMVGPLANGSYYPPEVAAQLAMRRLTDMYYASSSKPPALKVGPDLQQGPDEALSAAAEGLDAMRSGMFPQVGQPMSENVKAGLNAFANLNIYQSSPQLYLTVLSRRAA